MYSMYLLCVSSLTSLLSCDQAGVGDTTESCTLFFSFHILLLDLTTVHNTQGFGGGGGGVECNVMVEVGMS